MKKTRKGKTSIRLLIILSIDIVIKTGALTGLVYLLNERFSHLPVLPMILLGLCYIALISYFELHDFIYPLRELESAAAIIESGGNIRDTPVMNRKSIANPNASNIDRLVESVKTAIRNDYDSRILKTQAEIHALQSQINPHFLYNTLETIRSQALAQSNTEIAEMTEALSTLFRYSISKPGEMTTFEQEIQNVDNYLIIQQYRFPGKFKIVKRFEDEKILKCRLPVLTIQPLVENAVHHGLETVVGQGTIVIRAFCTQSRLVISVTDDGCGMSEEKLSEVCKTLEDDSDLKSFSGRENHKKDGIALINVNRRIKFYYGAEYGLKLYSTIGVGTTAELSLPNKTMD